VLPAEILPPLRLFIHSESLNINFCEISHSIPVDEITLIVNRVHTLDLLWSVSIIPVGTFNTQRLIPPGVDELFRDRGLTYYAGGMRPNCDVVMG
jgi:hypothetical protein